ncbi:MAG TPA: biopolymer transporter ExbD [Candidatus Paceibacterota bacterium]|nr:biopolymer transporter ExbD [Candidatus Paceibacterota bacterium]
MKFPRNARIFRGQLDAAPFISVFFLLVAFVVLGSLVYTPGTRIRLPVGGKLEGVDGPTIAVAVDLNGNFYFRNQLVTSNELVPRLHAAVTNCPEPLTLIVKADKDTKRETLDALAEIAKQAGLQRDLLLETLPRQ